MTDEISSTANYFTIVTPNFIPQARVLVRSILETCNPKTVTIFIVGSEEKQYIFNDLECGIEFASHVVGSNSYQDLMTRYGAAEVCFSLKPTLAEILLARDSSPVIFIDADCFFLSPPTEAVNLLNGGASAVLTPHIIQSATGRHYVDDRALLRSGSINAGFFGVSSTDEARSFLSWWRDRVLADCTVDDAHGTYYEQKWLDLAQSLFPYINLIRDEGYNIAYWNLHQRPLTRDSEGHLAANGKRAVFLHFSRWFLSTTTPPEYAESRIQDPTAAVSVLPLLESYYAAIQSERMMGGVDAFSITVDGQYLPDGTPITPIMRRSLWRNISVSKGAGVDILDILNAPSPRMPQFPPYTLSNFYEEFWLSRPDLRYNKFDVDRGDGLRAYVRWLIDVGQRESSIPECLMLPARNALRTDADLIQQRCVELEQILGHKENHLALLQGQIESLQADKATCEAENSKLESRIDAWIALSKGRIFRMAFAYMQFRGRLSGSKPNLPM